MTAPYSLQLPTPLRAVRLAAATVAAPEPEPLTRQAEKAAFESGRTEGEKNLSEQLLRQRREMLELQQGVLKSLQEAVPGIVRDCQQALTALTLELAQKLVGNLPISVDMVEAAVRECLSQVEETADCHLYLNPDDLQLLEQAESPLLSPGGSRQQFHWHRSPEVGRGGCVVKTHFGIVDAQRETKIELLKKSLLE